MATQFGKYQLHRKIAEGGMAEVFLAKQAGPEGFEKLVVLKRILPQLTSEENFVKMFLNEGRLAARLTHPNIVQIFELGRIEEQHFIAMEYVHGEDLKSISAEAERRSKRLPLALIVRTLADTLAGLHYAHTRTSPDGAPLGIVHRDVSPQNVLVTYDGGVKLVDFGIAKATQAKNADQTQSGMLKGKYAYMSPEQARGMRVDARSDVFSVGILLYELCTWSRLFKRNTEMATLLAVCEEKIPPPRMIEPKIPENLERIIFRALARDPAERYQTAHAMRADLEALIRQERWEADTLALESYMKELFEEKLRAQLADVQAAGKRTIEQFLLNIEENTDLEWMRRKELAENGGQATPSGGLPAQRAIPSPDDFDDGPTELAGPRVAQPTTPMKPAKQRAPVSLELTPTPVEVNFRALGMDGPTLATPSLDPSAFEPAETPRSPTTPVKDFGPAPTPTSPSQMTFEPATPSVPTSPKNAQASHAPITADVAFPKSPALLAAQGERSPSTFRRVFVAGTVALLLAGGSLVVILDLEHPFSPRPSSGTALVKVELDGEGTVSVDGALAATGKSASLTLSSGIEHTISVARASGGKSSATKIGPLTDGEERAVRLALPTD